MKKFYTLLILAFTVFTSYAQDDINIPDGNFRQALIANGVDTNGDFFIQVQEVLTVVNLDLTGFNIQSIEGIQYFGYLQNLNCSGNPITSISQLDSSPSLLYLNTLDCSYTQLTEASFSGINLPSLIELKCKGNHLTDLSSIVSSFPNLNRLDCSYNQLTTFSPLTSLLNFRNLACGFNSLTSLSSISTLNLISLDCRSNNLTSLDAIFGMVNLYELDCSHNQIILIPSNHWPNLHVLFCGYNQIEALDISGFNVLANLDCSGNLLNALDVSSSNTITSLYCTDNNLTAMDVSNLNLYVFNCSNNHLTSLNIKNGRNENFLYFSGNLDLEYICADEGQIAAVQTKIAQYGYPNCHVNSYCSFTPGGIFYTIQGNNRYDENTNGCDITDINYSNLRLSFTSGTATSSFIADGTGAYHYDVPANGYTISPIIENPAYFNISPTSSTVAFPSTASPFIQNFCVTANGVHNDLEVVILPITVARAGFDVTYKIVYKNKGTGTQSGTVNLAFEGSKMHLVLANPSFTNQATNSLSWSFSNLQPFETREILVTMNINSPTEIPAVNGGDILSFTATIVGATDETQIDNTSTLNQTVVNALDPNDKTCVEGITVSPSTVGQYVHYVVRFENTGTANAQNIVVKDMIDTAKYDVSSLVPLSGSASYVTRITNTNQVEFIFQNINLPFTAGTNTGYVAFKIKTKPTLVVGDTFSNAANIYFDYNFPVVTNTATTTIATLGTPDFVFSSMFSLSPVPAKNVLTITTKHAVVMSSANIYNTLGQLVQVNTNPNETIDVSGLKTGSYFIKIVSDKGTASGKFLKE